MSVGYLLAVDFGTTRSAGAVRDDGRVEVLEFGASRFVPSVVVLEDDGRLVAGRSAVNRAGRLPRSRVEFTPKRSVGESSVFLGEREFEPFELVAAVISQVAEEGARRFDGASPGRVVLTHPAGWARSRLEVLVAAADRAGLPEPELIAEPVAAALAYSSESRLQEGDVVAVYDLGGGTFDVAVMRRVDGGFEPCGPPGGDEHLGGELFDEKLQELVGGYARAQDPDGWERLRGDQRRGDWAQFRREVQEAKEVLSEEERHHVFVPRTDAEVSITRSEFEQLIADQVQHTISLFNDTLAAAGIRVDQLAAIYLTGGASRIPLVERTVRDRLGIDPQRWGDPKAVVATGATTHTARTASDKPPPHTQRQQLGAAEAPLPVEVISVDTLQQKIDTSPSWRPTLGIGRLRREEKWAVPGTSLPVLHDAILSAFAERDIRVTADLDGKVEGESGSSWKAVWYWTDKTAPYRVLVRFWAADEVSVALEVVFEELAQHGKAGPAKAKKYSQLADMFFETLRQHATGAGRTEGARVRPHGAAGEHEEQTATMASEFERLARLHKLGLLSDQEFRRAKESLLRS